jgi:hypothetical protein
MNNNFCIIKISTKTKIRTATGYFVYPFVSFRYKSIKSKIKKDTCLKRVKKRKEIDALDSQTKVCDF